MNEINLRAREQRYLTAFPYKEGPRVETQREEVRERYEAAETSAEGLTGELRQFAQQRGVDLAGVPESLSGRPFDADELKAELEGFAERLFDNPAASQDPARCALVRQETETFVNLLGEAQAAGHLGNFQADDAYRLVTGNLVALAFQDRASCETILGDHGVRHLVGHNIAVCDQLAQGLDANGADLGAEGRLVLHQAMLWHDIGYAMQPVRESINAEGPHGQDAGHPLLASRVIRERAANPADPLARIFTPEQIDQLHRCVLFHDKDAAGQPGIELQNPDTALESIMRLADNSHAFEDKLPEVLYRHPEAFATLKLLAVAQELGLTDAAHDLTAKLRGQVEGGEGRDNREAMAIAARQLGPEAVPWAVSRICAGPSVWEVTGPGQVLVSFEETLGHRDLMWLYDQPPLKQLNSVVRDLTGEALPDTRASSSVETPEVSVRMRVGAERAATETVFQGALRDALRRPAFQAWALEDATDAREQAAVQATVASWDQLDESERQLLSLVYPDRSPAESLSDIRTRRAERLRTCLKEMEA